MQGDSTRRAPLPGIRQMERRRWVVQRASLQPRHPSATWQGARAVGDWRKHHAADGQRTPVMGSWRHAAGVVGRQHAAPTVQV